MLVGREQEARQIGLVLERVRSGVGGVLLLRGDPGIGKSVLLAETVEQAVGLRVLRARGLETDAEIGFGVLADLCRPLADQIAELPALLREALAMATGAAAGPAAGGGFAVGRALAALLQNVAARQPVLIALDDGHWVDEASAYALLFAARRLAGSAVAIVVTLRSGEPSVFDGIDAASVELSPLDRGAAEALVGADLAKRVGAGAAEHVHRAAQGNPLALLELTRAAEAGLLDPDDDVAIPAGPRLAGAFAARLRRLPALCVKALTVVAASFTGQVAEVAGAMRLLGISEFDLDLARIESLIWQDGDRWQLRHPVFRSVVYQAADPQERRAVHQAFADHLAGDGEGAPGGILADQRAWHAAAAALPGDEAAAALLAATADADRARGALAAARRAYLRARQISAEPQMRALMSIGAAECAQVSGDVEAALALAAEAVGHAATPEVVGAADRLRHQITLARANADEVQELFESDAEALQEDDPDLAASFLAAAAATAATANRLSDTVRLGERATGLTPAGCGAGATAARTIYTYGLIAAGRAQQARTVLAGYLPVVRDADPWRQSFDTVAVTGMNLVWLGMIAEAGTYLTRTERLLRAAGAEEHLPLLLIPQALLAMRTGRWNDAHEAIEESRRLGSELGQWQVTPLAVALAARLAAARGLFTLVRDLATTTEQLIETTGATSYQDLADTATGAAYLAGGHPHQAIRVLKGVQERLLAGGAIEHSLFIPTFGDYIEALLQAGHHDAARLEVAAELPRAEAGGLSATLAVAYRCRAQVADASDADAWYNLALTSHAASPDPFETARTRLAYGRTLRRTGAVEAAGRQLEQAVQIFTALGAVPWSDVTDTELDLLTLPPDWDGPRLTAQERRVLRLAADGATDDQICETLGITPRRVDHDLHQIYDKLGVSRRSELGKLVKWEQPGTAAQPADPV